MLDTYSLRIASPDALKAKENRIEMSSHTSGPSAYALLCHFVKGSALSLGAPSCAEQLLMSTRKTIM